MKGVISVANSMGSGLSSFKTSATLLDGLILNGVGSALYQWRNYGKKKYLEWADETEALLDMGFAQPLPGELKTPDELKAGALAVTIPSEALSRYEAAYAAYGRVNVAFEDALAEVKRRQAIEIPLETDEVAQLAFAVNSYSAHAIASFVEFILGESVVSLERLPGRFTPDFGGRSDLMHITVEQIQLPSERMSWADVVALNQEPEFRRHLKRFRAWTAEIAKGGYSPADLRDQIEGSLSEYDHYMRAVGIDTSAGIVGWGLESAPEIATDLLDLRFGSALKTVIKAANGRSELLQLEAGAPGKHLSVVARLNALA